MRVSCLKKKNVALQRVIFQTRFFYLALAFSLFLYLKKEHLQKSLTLGVKFPLFSSFPEEWPNFWSPINTELHYLSTLLPSSLVLKGRWGKWKVAQSLPPPPYYIEKKSDFHPPPPPTMGCVSAIRKRRRFFSFLSLSLPFFARYTRGKEKGKVETWADF